jgi:glycosyltransferase involved in cell wall biosynthesis
VQVEQGRLDNMRILYVAYPLLTVSDASAGGAEQVLWTLEREISRRRAKTTVAASSGSRVAGELFATGDPCSRLDDFERRNSQHQERIIEFVTREFVTRRSRRGQPFDLVHDMSGSFWTRAAEVDVPVLATLHLPRQFYPARSFENVPGNVTFNFVSAAQARNFGDLGPAPHAVISNGIALDHFAPNLDREERAGLVWLGRICEEKGTHLALEIARHASMPLTIAGQTYPFSYHQRYFNNEVAPRLSATPDARFIGPVSLHGKISLLRGAKALLVTSQVAETSSLVAMEAAASGTPVIAFRRGALEEVVQDGVTGFLVDRVEDAVQVLRYVDEIKPAACAERAGEHFNSEAMAAKYLRLYAHLMHDEGSSPTLRPLSRLSA